MKDLCGGLFCYDRVMKPQVYIFRGSPASGKGTVAPAFAQLLPKPVALIEQDKLRWGFHLIGRSVEEVTSEEHRMAYENTLIMFDRYLRSGKYTIVVEGLFSWDNDSSNEGSVRHFKELAKKYGFDITSIVLRADREVLMKRNRERPTYTTPDDEFNALYDNVYSKIDESEIAIDSTHQTAKQTLDELRDRVRV